MLRVKWALWISGFTLVWRIEQIEKRPDFKSTTLALLIPDRVQFRAVTANLGEEV